MCLHILKGCGGSDMQKMDTQFFRKLKGPSQRLEPKDQMPWGWVVTCFHSAPVTWTLLWLLDVLVSTSMHIL